MPTITSKPEPNSRLYPYSIIYTSTSNIAKGCVRSKPCPTCIDYKSCYRHTLPSSSNGPTHITQLFKLRESKRLTSPTPVVQDGRRAKAVESGLVAALRIQIQMPKQPIAPATRFRHHNLWTSPRPPLLDVAAPHIGLVSCG